jgi:hypothetical protein
MPENKIGETWKFYYRAEDSKVAAFGRYILYRAPYYIFYATNDVINAAFPDFFIYFVNPNDMIEKTSPHATQKYDAIVIRYLDTPFLQLPLDRNMLYINYYDMLKELDQQGNDRNPIDPNTRSLP